jgi:hypothetical protein
LVANIQREAIFEESIRDQTLETPAMSTKVRLQCLESSLKSSATNDDPVPIERMRTLMPTAARGEGRNLGSAAGNPKNKLTRQTVVATWDPWKSRPAGCATQQAVPHELAVWIVPPRQTESG